MRKGRLLASGALACAVGALVSAGTAHTYASWSDYRDVVGNHVAAGVWRPDPPAACGPVSDYKGGVVYGTFGNDTIDLRNAPQSQIIIGLDGNDTIYAGNSGDCLVGGDGNDTLVGGNAKDILLGGAGDDVLNGNNGTDTLDGGSGTDECVGGHAPDNSTNCESTS